MKDIKVPTAEEFVKNSSFLNEIFTDEFNRSILIDKFIEFTKLHITEALKQVSEIKEPLKLTDMKGNTKTTGRYFSNNVTVHLNKNGILNAYDLNNIK